MNIDKPPWVKHGEHDQQSIFSVHVDPKGQRLATASSDAKVKIWAIPPLLSTAAERDAKSYPKLLATLIEHTAPVNTVRFSSDGRLLASCSDDQTTILYEQRPGVGIMLGEKPNIENWKHICCLKGHSNNVVDIAWAPDGQQLATCSLDNSIIVWTRAGRQAAVLDAHQSYVKGIAWDPIGTYLASQSDDKSIIVWRCSDWTAIHRITSPFEQNFITHTMFLRLAWSPDGQHLMGANVFDPPKHGACIIKRGSWKADLSVVGHKAPVTAISYCPVMFRSEDGDDDPDYCYVCGSQDRKLTIWQSLNTRPSAVLTHAFAQSITDLAWTADGDTLVASSTDGTVQVFQFGSDTFGKQLTAEQKQLYLDKKYGGAKASGLNLIEDAAMLELEQSGPQQPEPAAVVRSQNSLPQASRRPAAPAAAPAARRVLQADKVKSLGERTLMGPPGPGAQRPRQIVAQQIAPSQNRLDTSGAQRAPGPAQPAARIQPLPAVPNAISISLGLDEVLGFATELKLSVTNSGRQAVVACNRGAALHWKDQLSGGVIAACGNLNFSAVALQSGNLCVYSAAGRRLLPELSLEGPPHILSASRTGWTLMAVMLSEQRVRLWDLQRLELIASASIQQFRDIKVVGGRLTKSGCPLLFLVDGSARVLHMGLKEWLTVSNPQFSVSPYASQLAMPGELAQIERESAERSPSNPFLRPSVPNLDRRHLESKLSSALALESADEYKQWLLTYCRQLSEEGDDTALQEVCSSLLGPLRPTEEACKSSNWQPIVLGHQKHDLLKAILQEVARQRKHQRLVATMSEQLKAATQSGPPAVPL